MSPSLLRSRTAVTVMASFMSGPGLNRAGKHGRKTMIRKRWRDGEAVLSVEPEDEFWKAATTGEPVELTHELADKIGFDGRGCGNPRRYQGREVRSKRLETEGEYPCYLTASGRGA